MSISLLIEQAAGLSPRTILLLGNGVGREDAKALVANRSAGHAIQTVPQFALNSLGQSKFLGRLGRREILRKIWDKPAIRTKLAILEPLSLRTGFWNRLDLAVEAARRTDVSDQEWAVWEEVLVQKHPHSEQRHARRLALRSFGRALDSVMEAMQVQDEMGAIRRALQSGALTAYARSLRDRLGVESVLWISPEREEAVVEAFVANLSEILPVTRWDGRAEPKASSKICIWSSREEKDALGFLSRRLGDSEVILLPNDPSARLRLVSAEPISPEDPRDPTVYRRTPALTLLLRIWQVLDRAPFAEVTRVRLESVLHAVGYVDHVRKLREGGFVSGSVPTSIRPAIEAHFEVDGWLGLIQAFELGEFQLKTEQFLRILKLDTEASKLLCALFKQWTDEFTALGMAAEKFPIVEWIERLRERIREAAAPAAPLRANGGVRLFRGLRLPPVHWSNKGSAIPWIWAYGLEDEGAIFPKGSFGDECWSSSEREILSREFAVRSRWDLWKETQANLRAWSDCTDELRVVEARFEITSRGVRERDPMRWTAMWADSPFATHRIPCVTDSEVAQSVPLEGIPSAFQLPTSWGQRSRYSASLLESWSRCPAQALETRVLKWEDPDLPTLEPWPASKGAWLHRVLEDVIKLPPSISPDELNTQLHQLLSQAEQEIQPKGWINRAESRAWVRARMVKRLEQFWKEEALYRARSDAAPHALEWEFEWRAASGERILGRIDRIDRHRDGWIVMDYKSGSELPNGVDLVEKGYRTQLGIYALAVQDRFEAPVLAVQWIPLSARGGRNKGVFSKQWVASTPKQVKPGQNPIVVTRSALQVIDLEPDAIWDQVRAHVADQLRAIRQGVAQPVPRMGERECDRCSSQDFCGLSRRKVESETP